MFLKNLKPLLSSATYLENKIANKNDTFSPIFFLKDQIEYLATKLKNVLLTQQQCIKVFFAFSTHIFYFKLRKKEFLKTDTIKQKIQKKFLCRGTVEDAHLDFIQLINTVPHQKVIFSRVFFSRRSAKKVTGHYIIQKRGEIQFV